MSLAPISSPPAVWERVVCAIDGSDASVQAARVAARLMPTAGQLALCAVVNPASLENGFGLEGQLTIETKEALAAAQGEIAALHDSDAHLRQGPPLRVLLDELASEHATLCAVGSHQHSRSAGIALGSVATSILHEAPCSVLIVHPRADPPVPSGDEILVGFDASGGARRALAVGRELAGRLSLKLGVLIAAVDRHARGGWPWEELDMDVPIAEDPRDAVEALTDASHSASLLILGSRHLRGIPALGSVSERVAQRAGCPVLVVR